MGNPIEGLNQWTKENVPNMFVMRNEEESSAYEPTEGNPSIYWRMEHMVSDKSSYAVHWFTGQFLGYVKASSKEERDRTIDALMEELQIHREIILADGSPMFIKQAEVKDSHDPIREGQLLVYGQYGVLMKHLEDDVTVPLRSIHMQKGK